MGFCHSPPSLLLAVMLQSLYPTTLGVGTAFVPFAFCTMMILMGVYLTLPFIHDALKASSESLQSIANPSVLPSI